MTDQSPAASPATPGTDDAALTAALIAVRRACVVCRSVQRTINDVKAITKDDKSPVTVADFASQAVVAWTMREELGAVTLVAEEASDFLRDNDNAAHRAACLEAVKKVWSGCTEADMLDAIDLGGAEPTGNGSFWTLDPIDGTKGFLRNQQYAVALGRVTDTSPDMGVLGCPNLPRELDAPLDEPDAAGTIYAASAAGVTETLATDDLSEAGDPVPVTRLDHTQGDEIAVTASVEKAHTNVSDTDRILEHIRKTHGETIGEPARLDSQCKYAVVARGQADAYLRMPTKPGYVERIWDHAAGAFVATRCGATVSDIFGKPLDFSHGRGLETNKGVICAPPTLHVMIIDAIAALGIKPA